MEPLRLRRRWLLAAAAAALLSPTPALPVDLFSPGPLSRAHQSLEGGLESCTKCHPAGEQLSQDRCLDCHVELRARIGAGRGFHGRLPAAERQCWSCHHEHQGRDEPLVDWGKGGQRGFDHARTGFELRGKHRTVDCAKCHDARRIADPALRAVLAKQPGRKTFLGQPQACASCHFDEHRGQLGADCQRCHAEAGWKPARGFDHARTAFPLTGRHAQVQCAKCHKSETRAAADVPATITRPVNATAFLRMKGLASQRCTDCHRDPHQDRFGPDCTSCHTTGGWQRVVGTTKERAFHQKTRFPLEGAHASVACAACHGPVPGPRGSPARFRGLAFARCTDCHLDAHLGQFRALTRAEDGKTCDRCHTVEGFQPARFELEDHDRTAFPLDGAHRTVSCALCHRPDPALARKVPAAVRADLERRKRPVRVSLARFAPVSPTDCRACHADPHAGQFDRRVKSEGCTACHTTASFRTVKLDHTRDTSFPLTGKHASAACASCHRADAAGVVRYAPLATACASCHSDPHAGQLAAARGKATDCARCHGVQSWKELSFVHAPPFTRFELAGKHARLECRKCHPTVTVAGAAVAKYKPLPVRCEGCHEDHHKGAFRNFVPAGQSADAGCAGCHTPGGWRPVAFDHARTGFLLEGRHRDVSCKACHRTSSLADPVPRACSACHRDVHLGRLGQRCQDCHDPTSFSARTFGADAHRRTSFPLTGRHAAIACEECHGDRRDRGFNRPTPRCVGCHEADLARASGGATVVDHGAPGFPTDCRRCHGTWRFTPGTFPAHQACFDIRRGPHAGIRCLDCHTTLPPVDLGAPLTCAGDTANCLRCHGGVADEHEGVLGFALVNRKCYECHRFAAAP